MWLDNEDMARKFGQGELWDERWAEAQRAMAGTPEEFSRFLARNGITWVLAQGEGFARLCREAGLQGAARDGSVAVFRR